MQVAKCRLFLNAGHDVPGEGVTPAEVVVYRAIHQSNVGSDPVKELEVVGDEDRSPAQEIARLKQKYRATDETGKHIVDALFPGYSPELPETFEKIWPLQATLKPA